MKAGAGRRRAAALPVEEPEAEASPRLPSLPPWLGPVRSELLSAGERLHHALLVHGPAGIGKRLLVAHLVAGLLCEQRAEARNAACGGCRACTWVARGQHPDWRRILPEALDPDHTPEKGRKPSRQIRVEQVRALAEFMATGSHRGGWRVVTIDPADAMNHVTANALLKTLEEPGERTVIVLLTDAADRLLPTIRSRCRQVPIAVPGQGVALAWILSQGADETLARDALAAATTPLAAAALAEPARAAVHRRIVEAVAALPDTSLSESVDLLDAQAPEAWTEVLRRWCIDLARVAAGARPRHYPGWGGRLEALAARTHLGVILGLQDELGRLQAMLDHPLNPRLVLESILLKYSDSFDRHRSKQ